MDKTSGFNSQLYLASREVSSSLIWEGGRVGELRRTGLNRRFYMKETNRKLIGRIGLSMAINYFTCQGYTVSLPMNDT